MCWPLEMNFVTKWWKMIEYSIISSYPQMMTFDEDRNLLKNSLKPDFKGSEKVQIGCSGLTTDKLRTPSKLTTVFWELKDWSFYFLRWYACFLALFLLLDLMPIATVLMHGSVRGRALDLMLWKKERKKKTWEERVTEGTERERENPKKKIKTVK